MLLGLSGCAFATHLEPDAHGEEDGDVWLSASHEAIPEEFVRQHE